MSEGEVRGGRCEEGGRVGGRGREVEEREIVEEINLHWRVTASAVL